MVEIVTLNDEPDEEPATDVLRAAMENGLEHVLILGRTTNGEHYYSTSDHNLPNMIYTVERFKRYMLSFDKVEPTDG